MKATIRRRRRERGTQIAELALVLPLLAFLALVVSEGASFVRVHQVLNNAAREGARLSSLQENSPLYGGDINQLIARVQYYAYCNGVNLQGGSFACVSPPTSLVTCQNPSVTIDQNVIAPAAPQNLTMSSVTVQCGYPLTYLPKLPWFSVPKTISLTGSAQFRNLY
jgi:Flp pilus assembly protein TadG